MIQHLKVKGLNKQLDGEFEFNEDLNIFTGANGSGKTTLLKLLWYLISGHLEQILVEIPFHSIAIQTDLFTLRMERVEPDRVRLDYGFGKEEDVWGFIVIDEETGRISGKDVDWANVLEKRIAESSNGSLFFPSFRRIEGGFSIGSRSSAHPEDMAVLRLLSSTTEKLLTAISQLSEDISIDKHKFIFSVSTMDIIKLLPQKYVDIYQEISNLQSQVLEKISREIQSDPDKDKVGEMPKSASALVDAIQQVDKETEQLRKPISVLSELTRKILRYNAIRVTEKLVLGETTDGPTSEEGGDNTAIEETDDAISADKLSSGEKQMLSFLCYNAFSDKTSIFIDEPELSLHIDWQRVLLPTLLDQSTGNQFFIATHSPFIFSGYQHKEIPLKSD